ncbi:hypothetical protein ACIBEJ_11295 [Nonomuraea sp. NPDC050790]|uniref:hypothetical protein n=1 Tax=Nonomuraea sp. NPDC050790 TaxID=3364371 RepID=UPI0037B28A54
MAIDRSEEPEPAESARREVREEPANEDREALYSRLWEAADRQEFSSVMDRLRNEVQPKVRAVVEETRDSVPGAALVGLEFELKGEERYWQKTEGFMRDRPELSPMRAAAMVSDGLRYTYQFAAEDYVDGHNRVCGLLESKGLSLEHRWNAWASQDYKGVNTRWRTAEGDLFEVQFHTPESFAAKQETHAAYERLRDPKVSDADKESLEEEQREVSARVSIPEGVEELQDYRKRG